MWKALSGGLGPVVLVVVERRARRGRRNVGGSERMCGFDGAKARRMLVLSIVVRLVFGGDDRIWRSGISRFGDLPLVISTL